MPFTGGCTRQIGDAGGTRTGTAGPATGLLYDALALQQRQKVCRLRAQIAGNPRIGIRIESHGAQVERARLMQVPEQAQQFSDLLVFQPCATRPNHRHAAPATSPHPALQRQSSRNRASSSNDE